jgi:hypothetical protein
MASAPRAVQRTSELRRILEIPRRTWDGTEIAADLTRVLKTARGTQALRPVQGQALYELATFGGLFGPIRVGGGKTLVSLLASAVTCAKRPLLIVPAKLREKTRLEMFALSEHWRIPRHLQIESYEMLDRPQSEKFLELVRPDLIIFDESHKLKRLQRVAGKRIGRYIEAHGCRVCQMTGTPMKRSIADFAHTMAWSLPPENYPLPTHYQELKDWADALKDNPSVGLGHLRALLDPGEVVSVETVRQALQRRFRDTTGIVGTTEARPVSLKGNEIALTIKHIDIPHNPEIDAAFLKLRKNAETPDGWIQPDGLSQSRIARQLALGFYLVWDPRPPEWWSIPRQRWGKVCRYLIKYNRRDLDSQDPMRRAIKAGHYDHSHFEERWFNPKDAFSTIKHAAPKILTDWETVEERFPVNTVPVWISDVALRVCAEWMRGAQRSIVWTEHKDFARKLSDMTGVPYFGAQGLDKNGRFIEHAREDCIIASANSNGEGRNLQHLFDRNLITSPFPNGMQWEQVLGRTHRDYQPSDAVSFDVLHGCLEHQKAVQQGRLDAANLQQTLGQEQKLCYAPPSYPKPHTGPGDNRYHEPLLDDDD